MISTPLDLLREWILSGRSVWLHVRGESMQPFLPNGSRVLVRGAAADRIGPGDLLVYDGDGRFVCHRVLRRAGRSGELSFLTKGDHGWTLAAWISRRRVIGTVIAVERDGTVLGLETGWRRIDAAVRALRSLAVARVSVAIYLGRRLAARLGPGMCGR